MLHISCNTIPEHHHRYDTTGDYWGTESFRRVVCTDFEEPILEFTIIIHELIEQALCLEAGIPEPDITAFDMAFEEKRKQGLVPEDAQPGDAEDAPYRKQHQLATKIERILWEEGFGLEWK